MANLASKTTYHPPVHAPSSFARVGGGGWWGCRWCGVLSSRVSVCDDACMDGTFHDGIQSASACVNSRIQGFTGYHDDSCVRLNAYIHSRLVRGHELQG